MACAQPAAKRGRRTWNIEDKIWLLDYKKQNSKTNALELGRALAEHLNKYRSREQIAIKPPCKSTVGDWLRSEQQIREKSGNSFRMRADTNARIFL
jgi:hypothetical protein